MTIRTGRLDRGNQLDQELLGQAPPDEPQVEAAGPADQVEVDVGHRPGVEIVVEQGLAPANS